MAKPADGEAKKSYVAPALVIYGTIRDLTRAVGPHGSKDGGPPTAKRTTM